MSKGYWVVRSDVILADEYSKYIEITSNVINKYDGKFIVRGGIQTEFEEKGYSRTVVVEFSSYKKAIECYQSSEYQDALKIVKNSAKRLVSIVKGT